MDGEYAVRTLTPFLIVIVLMCSLHIQPASTLNDLAERDREAYLWQLQRAADYLKSNFNEDLKLICESPDTLEMAKTYWLVSDNLLASYALQPYYPDIAREIGFQLRNVWGYKGDSLQGIIFNHKLAPQPTCKVEAVTVRMGPDNDGDGSPDYIVRTERLTGGMLDVYDYADRICYQALTAAFHGNFSQANQYFNQAEGLWDGRGLADKVYIQEGYYETYKLALLYYTAKVLGRLDKLSFREDLLTITFRLQAANGGFYTQYVWGKGLKPYPGATTNTETTSLVILALTYMPEKPALKSGWLENHIITLFIAVILALCFPITLKTILRRLKV